MEAFKLLTRDVKAYWRTHTAVGSALSEEWTDQAFDSSYLEKK